MLEESSSKLLGDVERQQMERKASKGRISSVLHHTAQAPQQACLGFVHSWVSRKFASGCAILFPVVVTVYVTWWFLAFFDHFFSPLYHTLFGFQVFGLGFITSMTFILLVGVFFSSWMGAALLSFGEWIIKRLPLIKQLYSASKSVSAALNPGNDTAKAFQECVLIRHPRVGELAFAFITGRTVLRTHSGDLSLYCVYVPTNHVYVGDVFMLEEKDIIHTSLTVAEGLEIVVSVGMAVPQTLTGVLGPHQ